MNESMIKPILERVYKRLEQVQAEIMSIATKLDAIQKYIDPSEPDEENKTHD